MDIYIFIYFCWACLAGSKLELTCQLFNVFARGVFQQGWAAAAGVHWPWQRQEAPFPVGKTAPNTDEIGKMGAFCSQDGAFKYRCEALP